VFEFPHNPEYLEKYRNSEGKFWNTFPREIMWRHDCPTWASGRQSTREISKTEFPCLGQHPNHETTCATFKKVVNFADMIFAINTVGYHSHTDPFLGRIEGIYSI
jgi:hypothetical protein